MQFEARGVRASDGKLVKVTGQAESLDAFVQKLAQRGIEVRSARSIEAMSSERNVETEAMAEPPQADEASEAPSRAKRTVTIAVVTVVAAAGGIAAFLGVRGPGAVAASSDAASEIPGAVVSPAVQEAADSAGQQEWVPGVAHPEYPNVRASSDAGKWVPDAGYVFLSQWSLVVEWRSGLRHEAHPNIISTTNEGEWRADPGYYFPNQGDLTAKWRAGQRHPGFANILSAEREGYWDANSGYEFVSDESLLVEWKAGKAHQQRPNVVSVEKEGYWSPKPGYRFLDVNKGDLVVVWTPGIAHPEWPNVVASQTPDTWNAAPGYAFTNDIEGDLSTYKKVEPRWNEAIGSIVIALVAQAAMEEADTSTVGGAAGAVFAEMLRDEAVKSAVQNAFPSASASAVTATAELICIMADTRASRGSVSSVSGRLRARGAPSTGAEELARFVLLVLEAYDQSR